jgi:hypothetical protein
MAKLFGHIDGPWLRKGHHIHHRDSGLSTKDLWFQQHSRSYYFLGI